MKKEQESELEDLLTKSTDLVRSHSESIEIIRSLSGPTEEQRATLLSFEHGLNSAGGAVLQLLVQGYALEAPIVMRSLIEGHAKFVNFFISRREIGISLWEYEVALPIIAAASRVKTLMRAKTALEKKEIREPIGFKEELLKDLNGQIDYLKDVAGRKRKHLHPKGRAKLSDDQLAKIRESWEVNQIFTRFVSPARMPFPRLLQLYSDYSKASHFSSETLVIVGSDVPAGATFHLTAEEKAHMLLDVLCLLADRFFLLREVAKFQGPHILNANIQEVIRFLWKSGIKGVPMEYLGIFKVTEVEGPNISLELN